MELVDALRLWPKEYPGKQTQGVIIRQSLLLSCITVVIWIYIREQPSLRCLQ